MAFLLIASSLASILYFSSNLFIYNFCMTGQARLSAHEVNVIDSVCQSWFLRHLVITSAHIFQVSLENQQPCRGSMLLPDLYL